MIAGQGADGGVVPAAAPCCAICNACFMQLQTPRKLIPITRSQSSRVLSAVGTMRAVTPALRRPTARTEQPRAQPSQLLARHH